MDRLCDKGVLYKNRPNLNNLDIVIGTDFYYFKISEKSYNYAIITISIIFAILSVLFVLFILYEFFAHSCINDRRSFLNTSKTLNRQVVENMNIDGIGLTNPITCEQNDNAFWDEINSICLCKDGFSGRLCDLKVQDNLQF